MRETSEATEIEKLQKLEKWPNLGHPMGVKDRIHQGKWKSLAKAYLPSELMLQITLFSKQQ